MSEDDEDDDDMEEFNHRMDAMVARISDAIAGETFPDIILACLAIIKVAAANIPKDKVGKHNVAMLHDFIDSQFTVNRGKPQ